LSTTKTDLFPAPVVPFVRLADVVVRADWITPPRRLLDYLLFAVQEGQCVAEIAGQELTLGSGDVILIQPDELHSLRGTGRTVTPFIHFDVFYNERRTESFATKGGQVSLAGYAELLQPRLNDLDWIDLPARLTPVHPAQFQASILRAIELWQAADALSRLQADHVVLELLLGLFKQHGQVVSRSTPQRRSLGWIPSYLAYHLGEPLSVADMAARARLSPSRFATVFREDFGQSPHQYFLHLRIEHAQELLRGTDLPLKLIAEYCGFADVHHFSKSFKQRVRQSPGAYRATWQSDGSIDATVGFDQ
jgi:AraC-like DNA-binding protein